MRAQRLLLEVLEPPRLVALRGRWTRAASGAGPVREPGEGHSDPCRFALVRPHPGLSPLQDDRFGQAPAPANFPVPCLEMRLAQAGERPRGSRG